MWTAVYRVEQGPDQEWRETQPPSNDGQHRQQAEAQDHPDGTLLVLDHAHSRDRGPLRRHLVPLVVLEGWVLVPVCLESQESLDQMSSLP